MKSKTYRYVRQFCLLHQRRDQGEGVLVHAKVVKSGVTEAAEVRERASGARVESLQARYYFRVRQSELLPRLLSNLVTDYLDNTACSTQYQGEK